MEQQTHLSPQQRAAHFSSVFPQYCPLVVHNQRLYSTWVIGALFGHKSKFYGEFPYRLKDRILALFPDDRNILHLFSGTIHDKGTVTYDVNPSFHPTICDDVRNLKKHRTVFRLADLVVADPPYQPKDFAKYGVQPFNKAQVVRDLGHVGVVVSTNTRARMLTLWEHA